MGWWLRWARAINETRNRLGGLPAWLARLFFNNMNLESEKPNSTIPEQSISVPSQPEYKTHTKRLPNWRSRKLVCASVLLALVIAGCGAFFAPSLKPADVTAPTRPIVAPPAPSPTGTAPLSHAVPDATPATFPAVSGVVPTLIPIADTWPTFSNSYLGITIRYPPGWTFYLERPERPESPSTAVDFYPPGSRPDLPSPLISIGFDKTPYSPPSESPDTTHPQPITLGEITGSQYSDSKLAFPAEDYNIELPYKDGTLIITATEGPNVDLVPQLLEMLKSLVLTP